MQRYVFFITEKMCNIGLAKKTKRKIESLNESSPSDEETEKILATV
jgi:hypothetical protein